MHVAVISGGIVGLAVAHKLLETGTASKVFALDKEGQAGRPQPTHNSGVLHAGSYCKSGSAKRGCLFLACVRWWPCDALGRDRR